MKTLDEKRDELAQKFADECNFSNDPMCFIPGWNACQKEMLKTHVPKEDVEGLVEALEARQSHGHNDTCDSLLIKDLLCSCGWALGSEALKKFKSKTNNVSASTRASETKE